MVTSGYSGTPLLKKLGINSEMRVLLINGPDNYFAILEADISKQLVNTNQVDFVHLFATSKKELSKQFHQLIKTLPSSVIIWISWYKKSAKIPTDITEETIREIVLPTGWVDIKVCAVSELWSGLKIVRRKNTSPTPQPPEGGVIEPSKK